MTILLRAAHPLPAAAVTVLTFLLALSAGQGLLAAALMMGTVGLSQLAVGWANDALDAARDCATERRDKPLASGDLAARHTVGWAALTATVITLIAAIAWGKPEGIWVAIGLISAQLYNWPLKATIASIVPYLISFAALAAFAGAPWPIIMAAALLGGGAHLLNAIPDLADDAATGINGLPQRLGFQTSLFLAAGLLAAATVTLVVTTRPPWWASALALLLCALPIPLRRYADPRTLFRMVIVVALVDVLLLILSGAL